MLVERNIFRLKFGHAREALAALKDMMSLVPTGRGVRILTDDTGEAYRLILEISFNNYTEREETMKDFNNDAWREKYQQFVPHCESSYREFLRVAE